MKAMQTTCRSLFTLLRNRAALRKSQKHGSGWWMSSPAVRQCSSASTEKQPQKFDPKILEEIACPLSKEPLRYDPTTNELICDKLGVAYSIKDGIPNLVPSDARMIDKQE